MVVLEKVLEVKRLLDEGRLSRRAIALATGVSRGTVNAIASGDRGLFGAEAVEGAPGPHAACASRCPECGGLVYLPCVLCEARRHRSALGRAA